MGALRAPRAVHVRTTASAFEDPKIRAAIDATGRRQLLVAGVATEGAVVLTALGARAAGLQVAVVVDACGGVGVRSEDAALRQLSTAGVALTSSFTPGLELQHDFRAPHGQELMALIARWTSPATSA